MTSLSAPSYMAERRYSYYVAPRPGLTSDNYAVETPESIFEQQIYDLFLEAEAHLQDQEYGLALDAFEELQLLILSTADPTMPVDPNLFVGVDLPIDNSLVLVLARQAASMLQASSPDMHQFPPTLVAGQSALPVEVRRRLESVTNRGLVVTSFHGDVLAMLGRAAYEVTRKRWDDARALYEDALKIVPAEASLIRGAMLHDMAVLADKADQHDRAVDLGTNSLALMAGDVEAKVTALDTMAGVFQRAGKPDLAEQTSEEAAQLRATHNVGPIVVASPFPFSIGPAARRPAPFTDRPTPRVRSARSKAANGGPASGSPGYGAARAAADTGGVSEGTVLIAAQHVAAAESTKSYVVQNVSARIVLELGADGSTLPLLEAIATTHDLGLVTQFGSSAIQMVAYLPHMYFFVIPMAIGDCLAGLGNLEEAEQTYRDTLAYPYINADYEAVRLWTKLADVYLAMGDAAYRAARDEVAAFGVAQAHYARIVRSDGTLDPASPLYVDASFADIKSRVEVVLAAADPTELNENPELITRVLRAGVNLNQIAAGLNFFGLAPDYLAPFGWEYLQTTARYFAQSASQIEQRYILFKSAAENEELRRDQLDQQADVAAESVVLEERGLAEAQAGVDVAQSAVDYAEMQYQNAIDARNEFESVRWALYQLDLAELWTAAASNPAQLPLVPILSSRTLISQEMEADRLDRAVAAADAARDVARTQLAQAKARIGVADQRIVIAQLQQTYAEENRDYLDMREFNAGLWFDLAAQAGALTRRYQDLAIELALLTERAYNAETERGLQTIRYDYRDIGVGDLLGADRLLADIDAFTADYITTVKSKKLPVKKVISLADACPMAFNQLRTHGRCLFGTEFADFDREHPGLYLCKLRNVELALVGITGATGMAGSLRNVGVSRFRREDGSFVSRTYPPDVMPISQYSARGDALLFRFNPNELRAFELNGIDTQWQLELPPGANRFPLGEILDAQLILYYDGYFSPSLEASVKAALPTTGASARSISLAMELPDELFYLKSNGDAEIRFTAAMFAANQTNRRRTDIVLKLTGAAATIGNLTLRLASNEHGEELTLTTSAAGQVDNATPGQPLRALLGEPVLDRWTIRITAEDNPHLVRNGKLELGGLRDFLVFFEYSFDFR